MVTTDLPKLILVLQPILDHIQQSSQNISALHAITEAKIEMNNDKLAQQERLINSIGKGGFSAWTELCIWAITAMLFLKVIRKWYAILILAAVSTFAPCCMFKISLIFHSTWVDLQSFRCTALCPSGSGQIYASDIRRVHPWHAIRGDTFASCCCCFYERLLRRYSCS